MYLPNLSDIVTHESQWVERPIDPLMEQSAVMEQENLRSENFGNKTQIYNPDNDVIGVLAREAVRKHMQNQSRPFTISEYVPNQYGDELDLTWDGINFDIKGWDYRRAGDPRLPFIRGKIYENQFEKLTSPDSKIDAFMFVVVARGHQKTFIVGWCPRAYYFRYAYLMPRGFMLGDFPAKATRAELEAHRLFPLSKFSPENYHHINKHFEPHKYE